MLSVVVPTYQAEACLPRLLASLNPEPDWEVIIVDDGSSDETADIAKEWLRHRSSGRFIQLRHSGPGVARQVGLEAATREFVTFSDADDEVVVATLAAVEGLMATLQLDVAITAFEYRPRPRIPRQRSLRRAGRSPSRAVLTNRAAIWGKVYRRSFLVEHDVTFPPIRSADDVIFSWRLASARPSTWITDDVGYLYWVDPHGQLTRDPQYFVDGIASLGTLWNESTERDLHARTLALFAVATGYAHILRRTSPAMWSTLFRAMCGQMRATRVSSFVPLSRAPSSRGLSGVGR